MNKARITYRFDHKKEQFDQHVPSTNESQGTSLLDEDFWVRDGQDDGSGEKNSRSDDRYIDPDDGEKTEWYDTRQHIHDSQMLNQFTTDYGAWSSPFDIETERLEQLIRQSDEKEEEKDQDVTQKSGERSSFKGTDDRRNIGEGAVYESYVALDNKGSVDLDHNRNGVDNNYDVDDRHFDYSEGPLFDENLRSSHVTSYGSSSYRTGTTSWLRVIVSVAGAIATGLLFGLFIMQLFTNLVISPEAPPVSLSDNEMPDEQWISPEPIGQSDADIVTPVSVNVPSQTFYMLQFGVFTTAEGARAAMEQLEQAGTGSSYEMSDRHVVFAGITPDRNSALLLSNQLEKLGLETYVKPYERPMVRSLVWGEATPEQIETYISDGSALARTISLLTLIHLEETSLTNFEDMTIEALTQSHQRWTIANNQLSRYIPEEGEGTLQRMHNELTTAVNSLIEYRKNPSVAYLWQAQSAVMNYVILEKQLLQQLAG